MSSVSFVVTSRNDEHGGKMLTRMRVFMESLLTLANKYHLKGELIVVEWNPPEEKPRLWETLKVSVQSLHFPVRYIEVPASIHNRFRNADSIPLYQMIAKNVGIRRARGEFVLCTAIDLLFSEELISYLSRESLDDRAFYRIDRYDVCEDIPLGITIEEMLRWCREKRNIIRLHRRRESVVMNKKHSFMDRIVIIKDKFFRFKFAMLGNYFAMLGNYFTDIIFKLKSKIFECDFRNLKWDIKASRVHTNACGDFTLMSQKCWEELRGYPEIPIWSMHIDSILCYMAITMGLRQVILKKPLQIFHIEHENSWVTLSPEEKLSIFLEKPWLPFEVVKEIRQDMFKSKKQPVFNDEDWGLANEDLPERVFGDEEW